MKRVFLLAITTLVLLSATAQAELTIEITQGRDNPTPVAIVPFSWQGSSSLAEDVAQIVESDLYRSGQFAPMRRSDMLDHPHSASEVHFSDWRRSNTDYLVVGRLSEVLGQVQAEVELFDVYGQKSILTISKTVAKTALRDLAHHISDKVYQQLTGIRGAFSTKLLYVSAAQRGVGEFTYRLLLSDIDGAREQVLIEQNQPLLAPAWAPDGRRIAYVSFETTRSAVYIYDLASKQHTQITNFTGINGSPSWSPDGTKLAMVLSKDGSPDIYVMDLASRQLTRVTRHYAIDTEPSWLPDGKSLVYTSDRGGKPQIYQVTLASGYEERLTFEGQYNARARVLPDGRGIIMVHQGEGDFHIALMDIERGDIEILTETALDESPSIAPNGTMLLYATQHRGKGILSAVSVDGGVKFHLPSRFGDVREPAWSPFLAE
ncbi:Tol-Pal system beta propeller repeat protein TolB [Dasania sp. GY-MA-18]|uniref:Tol-Pal system protein TolB n=1 Tax=Dasania phycosphaerae TaxID=2950436 RepID=A0A9J6RH79_9GAMM|nr:MULTISPECIES: Tol-Pal system beta propeller repeat protein TolB [Dasania]MCR8921139.1 Tol-Pal system beta propeller repeat protein TolB [Dasania sp. GY-MA-18]MCZ0863567.1 Tol-Pal system beta propeller repeat protein TolB [Dasania phycosphaerae]MCZ0867295.1 Tol-Pal system beta propeller repeat protein TolB [Dasania phycosphaerae]